MHDCVYLQQIDCPDSPCWVSDDAGGGRGAQGGVVGHRQAQHALKLNLKRSIIVYCIELRTRVNTVRIINGI